MAKKYIVRLTSEERSTLKDVINKGKAAAYRIKHANILLKADADGPNWTNEKIAQSFECALYTVISIRKRFVEQGFEAALGRKKRECPPVAPILDGEKEARLIQIACSEPPEGHARWTLNLLADKLVTLDVVESISGQTVGRTLKKTNSNLIEANIGLFPRRKMLSSLLPWRTYWMSIIVRIILIILLFISMNNQHN